jgi:hypothetical protein
MDTKRQSKLAEMRNWLNRMLSSGRQPQPPPQSFQPAEPEETVSVARWNYRPAKRRYRNPVIKQAPSTDPRFNHALRRKLEEKSGGKVIMVNVRT